MLIAKSIEGASTLEIEVDVLSICMVIPRTPTPISSVETR